jgi:ABC-type glutathione transport system ATPase component
MPEIPSVGTNALQGEASTSTNELVRVEHVSKFFPVQTGLFASLLNRGNIPSVKAVDDVSFTIFKGEVFGLREIHHREIGLAPVGSHSGEGDLRRR